MRYAFDYAGGPSADHRFQIMRLCTYVYIYVSKWPPAFSYISCHRQKEYRTLFFRVHLDMAESIINHREQNPVEKQKTRTHPRLDCS